MSKYFEMYQNLVGQMESFTSYLIQSVKTINDVIIKKFNEKTDEELFAIYLVVCLSVIIVFLYSVLVLLIYENTEIIKNIKKVILASIEIDKLNLKTFEEIEEKLLTKSEVDQIINKKIDKILDILQEDFHIVIDLEEEYKSNHNNRKRQRQQTWKNKEKK